MTVIDKQTFIEAIKNIRKQEEINEKISNALDPICEGNGFFYDGGRFYRQALLEVLKKAMNDEDEILEWWLYEIVGEGGHVVTVSDIEYVLKTSEDVYDFLVKYYIDDGEGNELSA